MALLWGLPPARASGASDTDQSVSRMLAEVRRHYDEPLSRRTAALAGLFHELAKQWRQETRFLSSLTEMAIHPAYQRIIGLGRPVLPLVLAEMGQRPGQWFWALKAITGVDPVPPAQRGRLSEMTAAWTQWGREEGLID